MTTMEMSHRNTETINFLNSRTMTKEFVERVVLMIPEREFYYPEIDNQSFKSYRLDLNDLVKQARYDKRVTAQMNSSYLQKEYSDELSRLVTLKRRLLIFGILLQEEDKKREIIYSLAKENHLQNRVLALKETYRK